MHRTLTIGIATGSLSDSTAWRTRIRSNLVRAGRRQQIHHHFNEVDQLMATV
ncbi:MAG: hypothetical protein HC822_19730 [Oscillochloris sp.]|nr:hypothetical protein [Oscillochloris sp.]